MYYFCSQCAGRELTGLETGDSSIGLGRGTKCPGRAGGSQARPTLGILLSLSDFSNHLIVCLAWTFLGDREDTDISYIHLLGRLVVIHRETNCG